MSVPDPIAIAEDGAFAFLRKPRLQGEPPQVVSIWKEEGFRFRTFQGEPWQLPTPALLLTVCNLHRSKIADNGLSVTLRDAHGVDLNNLAALYMCEDREEDAFKALAEAEQQFLEISRLFGAPTPTAQLDLAVVLHNLSIIEARWGRNSSSNDLRDEAHHVMATIPDAERNFGYGFVASALGYTNR